LPLYEIAGVAGVQKKVEYDPMSLRLLTAGSKEHLWLYYMAGPLSHASSFLKALEWAFENM